MRYFETLIYAGGWAGSAVPLEAFVLEMQRLADARGLIVELVQPVWESDETASLPGPLAVLKATADADDLSDLPTARRRPTG